MVGSTTGERVAVRSRDAIWVVVVSKGAPPVGNGRPSLGIGVPDGKTPSGIEVGAANGELSVGIGAVDSAPPNGWKPPGKPVGNKSPRSPPGVTSKSC